MQIIMKNPESMHTRFTEEWDGRVVYILPHIPTHSCYFHHLLPDHKISSKPAYNPKEMKTKYLWKLKVS